MVRHGPFDKLRAGSPRTVGVDSEWVPTRSLFHKSIKPANLWFERLTTNGPEPVTLVLSLPKDEIRRLMKHPPRGTPTGDGLTMSGRGGA